MGLSLLQVVFDNGFDIMGPGDTLYSQMNMMLIIPPMDPQNGL